MSYLLTEDSVELLSLSLISMRRLRLLSVRLLPVTPSSSSRSTLVLLIDWPPLTPFSIGSFTFLLKRAYHQPVRVFQPSPDERSLDHASPSCLADRPLLPRACLISHVLHFTAHVWC